VRKVQELEANAERQQKQIEALTAGLQKVSAQLELSKFAPEASWIISRVQYYHSLKSPWARAFRLFASFILNANHKSAFDSAQYGDS
jgi:hypothetical protein